MVKFVATDAVGLPQKRNHSQHACGSCRRRKRRCLHSAQRSTSEHVQQTDEVHERPASPSQIDSELFQIETPGTSRNSPANFAPEGQAEAPNTGTSELRESTSSRFVGDLNPEGVFIEATSTAARDLSNHGGVGVWHSNAVSQEPVHLVRSHLPDLSQLPGIFQTDPAVRKVLLSYLEGSYLRCVPPAADFDALRKVYLQKIHPIFPVLDQLTFRSDDISPSSIIMKQAICLAASTNRDAAPHLRLGPDGPLLTHQNFSQRLSIAMRSALDFGFVTDKLVLIRSCAILSLYIQPLNPSEADLPALLNGRAVHYVQTLGLHHAGHGSGSNSGTVESLFCAIWALDKLNAAFYGRPILMHERDLGRDLDLCFAKQQPCFQLFLEVVRWLDKVISLYRPNSTSSATEMSIELPCFEDLVHAASATREMDSVLTTIEIFYHAVSILSCRFSSPCSQSQTQISESTVAKIRGISSAVRITSIVAEEFHHQAPFLPVVPYALSLSLGVAYRELRRSRIPLFRARAKAALKANCALLGKLGDLFWSAGVMARMGEQVLEEMEKAIDSIAQIRQQDEQEAHAYGNRVEVESSEQSRTFEAADGDIGYLDGKIFNQLPELDVFEYFDPSFDLDTVDAVLGANLDVRMPLSYAQWGQSTDY